MMETMTTLLAMLVSVAAVLGAIFGAAAWIIRSLDERVDTKMDRRFTAFGAEVNERFNKIDERFNEVDERFNKINANFGTVNGNLDHLREVTDIRLAGLESDMTIIKRHLLPPAQAA